MRYFSILALTFGTATLLASPAVSQGDLFIRVTASDTGAEPYTGPGPVYLSPDIWVRNDSDPNFDPYPYPTNAPAWIPAPHQNPEHRDTKTARPNFVYVRIHNRGRTPSLGTERLRLYQAKASTGLSWPASWVDNMDNACGMRLLHGIEITKPRMNAKDVSVAERIRYRDAVIAVAEDPAFQYSDGMQYFTKQNMIHTSGPEHGNPAFPPWHREMVNRYERLLQEADPLTSLLYWDFTEDPVAGTNLFDQNFMGNSSGTVTGPLADALPTTISRNVGGSSSNCGLALFSSDATLLGNATYPNFRSQSENTPNHNCAHGYIGGFGFSGNGPISAPSTAVRDPFFFLLHSNVDRQWAMWQRDGADPARIDPVSAYGSDSSNSNITGMLSPWDGSFSVQPWTGAGVTSKNSFDRSIVFPPIYDTAPLRIPVLQPEESVVIEIPWFPPNKNSFDCAGGSGHFCLLARIETQATSPFGMTTPETMNVSANTIANNNIAWKNVTIVDDVTEPLFTLMAGTTVRNLFRRDAFFALRLVDRTSERRFLLHEAANVGLILPEEILERAFSREGLVQDFDTTELNGIDRKVLRVTGKEPILRIPMKPLESFTAQVAVQMHDEKVPEELLVEPFLYDIEQLLDLPGDIFDRGEQALGIGGVRFEFDIARALKAETSGPLPDELTIAELDRLTRFRDLTPVELTLELLVERLQEVPNLPDGAPRHVSPGEPLAIVVGNDDPARTMQRLSVEIDGVQRFENDGPTLRETVSFDEPGVYTIVTRGLDAQGRLEQRRDRVLVSEDIPPITSIVSPQPMTTAAVGQEVVVTADTIPAYERQVEEVTLHVKSDDLFATGLSLVESDAFPPVDRREGPGPHALTFVPEAPGRYMLQVGARDDAGNLGMSGHIMVEVQ